MNSDTQDMAREKLFDEFNNVVAETEQLLRSVASAGSDKAGLVKANVEQRLAAASEHLGRIRAESLAQARAAAVATDEFVKNDPWRAVAVVAAVSAAAGLITGLFLARR